MGRRLGAWKDGEWIVFCSRSGKSAGSMWVICGLGAGSEEERLKSPCDLPVAARAMQPSIKGLQGACRLQGLWRTSPMPASGRAMVCRKMDKMPEVDVAGKWSPLQIYVEGRLICECCSWRPAGRCRSSLFRQLINALQKWITNSGVQQIEK